MKHELTSARARWSEAVQAMDHGPEASATRLAIMVADLCEMRSVSPRLDGDTVVIPAAQRGTGTSAPAVTSSGPVSVHVGFMSPTVHRAQEISHNAQKATVYCEGWEPIFLDLLRPYCTRTALEVVR